MADDFGSWLLAGLSAPFTGGMSLAQQSQAVESEKRRKQLEEQSEQARKNKRAVTFQGIEALKAPTQSEAVRRRIAAMEQDAAAPIDTGYYDRELQGLEAAKGNVYQGPASQDPMFAAKQLQLAQQGAQGIAGVMNRQAGQGLSGGFQNVGSTQDIADRLAGATANLGQQQFQFRQGQLSDLEKQRLMLAQGREDFISRSKERRRMLADQAAQMQQSAEDAQREFANMQARARTAAEQGDIEMALELSRQAMQAKEKADAAMMKFYGNVASGVMQGIGTAAGAMIGGPQGAQAGGAMGKSMGQGMQPVTVDMTPEGLNKIKHTAEAFDQIQDPESQFGYGKRLPSNTWSNISSIA